MTIKASSLTGGGGVAPFFNDPIEASAIVAGNFYLPAVNYGYLSADIPSADILTYMPFVTKFDHTFTGISVLNTGTGDSGEKIRLGIYDNVAGSVYPNDLIIDAGEITLDATAAVRTLALTQALTADTIYWLAIVNDTALNLLSAFASNGIPGASGWPLASFGIAELTSSQRFGYAEAHSYATLPATASPDGSNSTALPLVFLKG